MFSSNNPNINYEPEYEHILFPWIHPADALSRAACEKLSFQLQDEVWEQLRIEPHLYFEGK